MPTLPSRLRLHRHLPLPGLLFICLVLLLPSGARAQSGPEFPSGVGINLKNEDTAAGHLTKAQATGAKVVRKGIYWENNEPTPGHYDWSQADQWINDMDAKGFKMVIVLVWNNRDYEPTYKRAITTQAGRDAFANYAATVVDRYKDKDIIWEIWNEPNLNSFWYQDGNPSNTDQMADEYTELVKDAVPAMKAADPNCKIAVGSISALWTKSFDWFERCVDQGILTADIDYISVHPYGFRWPELAYRDGYPVIRQMLDSNGGQDIGIINSEVGYSDLWLAERGFTDTEDAQAWQFVRQNMVDAMSDIHVSIWYEFSDPKNPQKRWGVVNHNLTERKTFLAAQVMTAQLDGYTFRERIDLGDDLDFAALFENANGDKQLVVWTTPEKSGPINERRPVDHVVAVPVGVPADYEVTDLYGNTTTLTTGSSTLDITLTGAPQYIPLAEEVVTYSNVALGKTATASKADKQEKLTDGDYTNHGRWFSNWFDNDGPQWMEVDLGGMYAIDQVVIAQGLARIFNYKIEAWDGSDWVEITTGDGTGQLDVVASFSPVATDKVRFTALTGEFYLKVFHMEVYGTPYVEPPATYENVALGKTATASKMVNPDHLNDGEYTDHSRWFSNWFDDDGPQWMEIDLGTPHTVDQIVLSQNLPRTEDWHAEVWDGSAWVQVASGTGETDYNVTATFAPVSTTKVRFTVTAGEYYLKVYELEIYGAPDS